MTIKVMKRIAVLRFRNAKQRVHPCQQGLTSGPILGGRRAGSQFFVQHQQFIKKIIH